MKMVIEKVNCKWLVNGREFKDMSETEKVFFREFIIAMKWESQMDEMDNNKNQKS